MTIWTDEMKSAAMADAQKVCDLAELLRAAREALAWHWEATSGPEGQNKESLLQRIDSALAAPHRETKR